MNKKNIEDKRFIEVVYERDIDLLLLEEITVSKEFRDWFVKKACGEDIKEFVGTWHSIPFLNTEMDLVIIFISQYNKKYALLIEDKIGALAQKDQPQRYRHNSREGIIKKEWNISKTCIVAPKDYLETNKEAEKYQCQVSYEAICEWFLRNKSERDKYKSKIITEAIEQNRRGYTKITDPKTSEFHMKFYKYVSKNYPKLEMIEPLSRASKETWIYFSSKKLKPKMDLVYKGRHGFVDLEFKNYGNKRDKLKPKLNPFRKKNMTIEKTNKSASLRIKVPTIDPTLKFESQIKNIKIVLKTAKKLLKIGINLIEKNKI